MFSVERRPGTGPGSSSISSRKLDGSGYPGKMKGDEISMMARIMAVADICDTLNTDRPYRKAMPREKA